MFLLCFRYSYLPFCNAFKPFKKFYFHGYNPAQTPVKFYTAQIFLYDTRNSKMFLKYLHRKQGPHSPGKTQKPEKTWKKTTFLFKTRKIGVKVLSRNNENLEFFKPFQKSIFHNKIWKKHQFLKSGSTTHHSVFISTS